MKLSLNWLSKFLTLDEITPEEVANRLTMGAFEVEDIQTIGPKLSGPIVVGKVLAVTKHPNADRLSVTNVTTDGKNKLQIVCGAKNIKEGQKVPVSLDGAIVVNRKDGSELAIKSTKIRDIESFGMLCAPGELGLQTQDSEGILILPEDAKVGESIVDYLSLNQDIVLEVGSRSNRGDALSVYGLSREIKALTKKSLKKIIFKTPVFDKSIKNTGSFIENTKDTYLFYTVTVEEVKIQESPQWLKSLLQSANIRSVNNIVDITNYINVTFGQPMHAYDREKLKGTSLTARLAKTGEKIETLDGKVRNLKENVLVIADETTPMAIAGIMGAKKSEVTEKTQSIVLEAAVFNPVRVRKGSRTVGLSSDASKRFERGVDSNFTYNALLSAIELIENLAATDKTKPKIGPIQQAGESQKKQVTINLPLREIKRVLGIDLSQKEACDLLNSLEFETKKLNNEEGIVVTVPSHRVNDVQRPIDLIEEISRLYGYDKIPSEPPPSTISPNRYNYGLQKVKNHFLSCGFCECFLSSLIGEQILSKKEFYFEDSCAIKMLNPLSNEHSVLRQSLIPGLLDALKSNQSHQNKNVKLFEIGKVYFSDNLKELSENTTNVNEKLRIAGVSSFHEENWFANQHPIKNPLEYLFFSLKGILEGLLLHSKYKIDFSKQKISFLHPNLSAKILLNNTEIGVLGCLHPSLESKMELAGPVILFELDIAPVLSLLEKDISYEKISSQPLVARDITADLPNHFDSAVIIKGINKISSDFVININLINVYKLDDKNRSLTFRLKFQHLDETLTSEEVESEINKIKEYLKTCFQAKYRV